MIRFLSCALMLAANQASADENFEERVLQAILENPQVILLAIEQLELQKTQEAALLVQREIDARAGQIFGDDQSIILASFFDYRCGYCAQSAADMKTLPDEIQEAVRLIELPILGAASEEIAKVSLAVRNIAGQGAYREFHHAVFEAAGRVGDTQSAIRLAGRLGHDEDAISREASGNDVAAELLVNARVAKALGIIGTPTFVGRKQVYGGMLTAQEITDIFNQGDQS